MSRVFAIPMDRFHGQRSQEWRTPLEVFRPLDAEFHFTLDVCATFLSAKCLRFFTEASDGLKQSWAGERIFCNPPYRKGSIERWLAKAREAELAVYLLPSRTGAAWWHDYAVHADEIRFIRGRLKFGGSKINAPEWSVILIYRGKART